MKRYLFLDRDGTIIKHIPYLSDPRLVVLLPGVVEGLQQLQSAGWGLVVVTNQSGVGRGYFTPAQVEAVNRRMEHLLAASGICLDGIYYCPHHPQDMCKCRKPETGMVEQAVGDLGISLEGAAVVGDSDCDVGLGKNLDLLTFGLLTAHSDSWGDICPDHYVNNLLEVAQILLEKVE